jgi:hypothetical protein
MNRPARPRRSAAFTLAETLIATFIIGMLGTLLFQMITPSLRGGKIVGSKASLLQKARYGMDQLTADIRGSAGVVSSYGGYQSDEDTLILRAPAYDAAYRQIVGSYDYLIFRLEGDAAPHRLIRTVFLAPGSARPGQGSRDVVLVENVASLAFTCYAQQTFTGDGVKRQFPLLSVSLRGALTGLLSGDPTAITAARVQVYDFVIADGLVTFDSPLALGAKVRLLYRVRPTGTTVESFISSVDATLRLADPDPSLSGPAAPSLELTGGASLKCGGWLGHWVIGSLAAIGIRQPATGRKPPGNDPMTQ